MNFLTEEDLKRCLSPIGIECKIVDKRKNPFDIKKVIFNDPATIVFWTDGTKTVVKCGEEDVYDYQTGLLMCIAKKAFGNKGKFNDILREWIPEEEEKPSPTAFTFDISPADFENNSVLKLLFGGNADA